jgi:hypothetical protein
MLLPSKKTFTGLLHESLSFCRPDVQRYRYIGVDIQGLGWIIVNGHTPFGTVEFKFCVCF